MSSVQETKAQRTYEASLDAKWTDNDIGNKHHQVTRLTASSRRSPTLWWTPTAGSTPHSGTFPFQGVVRNLLKCPFTMFSVPPAPGADKTEFAPFGMLPESQMEEGQDLRWLFTFWSFWYLDFDLRWLFTFWALLHSDRKSWSFWFVVICKTKCIDY